MRFFPLKILISSVILAFIAVLTVSFDTHPPSFYKNLPAGWRNPVYSFSQNKLTPAGRELGKKLFYDAGLSRDGTKSCGSCHQQGFAFAQAGASMSHGVYNRTGTRNTPAIFNLAWNTSFLWDGGANNLEVQPLAPLTNTNEMDNTLQNVVHYLQGSPTYKSLFATAFGDTPITGQRALKALAQFTGSILSANSRYDKYVRHEPGGTMTKPELNGLRLFRANCATCHAEPLFTNFSFRNNGLGQSASPDNGRMHITGNSSDSLLFKVPSLRNVAVTPPYMHDGSLSTLTAVLNHYATGIAKGPTLAPELKNGIYLTAHQQNDIIAFLGTLTDSTLLTDPTLAPPQEPE